MVGPTDVLVYADPWFASVAWFWLLLCATGAAVLVTAALCLPVGCSQQRPTRGRSLTLWALGSLLVGLVFAGPWIYGFICLMARS
jgi:hypothetical protein